MARNKRKVHYIFAMIRCKWNSKYDVSCANSLVATKNNENRDKKSQTMAFKILGYCNYFSSRKLTLSRTLNNIFLKTGIFGRHFCTNMYTYFLSFI